MQKTIDREEFIKEVHYVWICPNCGCENIDCEISVSEAWCFSCGECFEVED